MTRVDPLHELEALMTLRCKEGWSVADKEAMRDTVTRIARLYSANLDSEAVVEDFDLLARTARSIAPSAPHKGMDVVAEWVLMTSGNLIKALRGEV